MCAGWDERWTDVSAHTSLAIPAGKSSQTGGGWMKKSPSITYKQPGGENLQGKRRINPAGQQPEGEQEEQIPKEHGLFHMEEQNRKTRKD